MSETVELNIEGLTKPEQCSVVRVSSSNYYRGGSLVIERKLTPLKKMSIGYHPLVEGKFEMLDYLECMPIMNLHEVCDGIYQLVMCNLSYDWESGYLDDWEWKLVGVKNDTQCK